MKRLNGLRKKLATSPKLPEAYAKAEKSINGLIDSFIVDIQQIKIRHNEYIEKHVNSYRKFEQLRQKLVNGEPMNKGEATGDTVAQMLKEIEEESNLGNPYCLSGVEVEQCMVDMRQRMTDIRMDIETLWTKSPITEVHKSSIKTVEKPLATKVEKPSTRTKEKPSIKTMKKSSATKVEKHSVKTVETSSSTLEFRDCTVAVSDLAAMSSTVTTVSFVGCRSKEWIEVGQRLATLP
jgi:hypothetical protein